MVNGIAIDLFEFQEKAVLKLLDIVSDSRSKQTVTVKIGRASCRERV